MNHVGLFKDFAAVLWKAGVLDHEQYEQVCKQLQDFGKANLPAGHFAEAAEFWQHAQELEDFDQ